MASRASPHWREKMEVVIVGGSISGLMHAIMLRSLGHNVRVLEKQDSARSDYGAGIGVGVQGKRFLDEYDTTPESLTYDSPGFKFLGLNNEIKGLTPLPLYLTSWTALYYRLRGLYDGLPSPFCPRPPPPSSPTHGTAAFETHKKVVGVAPGPDGLLSVTYEDDDDDDDDDDDTARLRTVHAHLVIDGSGPYSVVRSSVLTVNTKPRYAGFLAWRGTVPDHLVSEATNQVFDERFLIFPMGGGNYCVGYKVPGKEGSHQLGQRLLNWVWYTTMSDPDELEAILTDRDGHRHFNSVPRGKLNMTEWIKQRDAVLPDVNLAFRELMCATEEPFVSKIHESFVSQRSYFDGRLLLVGDGANLMCPNGGQSTNHTATQCLALRDVLQGKMSLREWETVVADQGWQMKLFSDSMTSRFLHSKFWATVASLRLGFFIRWLRFKAYVKRVATLWKGREDRKP